MSDIVLYGSKLKIMRKRDTRNGQKLLRHNTARRNCRKFQERLAIVMCKRGCIKYKFMKS